MLWLMQDGRVHMGLVLTGGTIGSTKVDGMVVIDLTEPTFPEAALVEQCWPGPGKIQIHTRVPLRKLSEDMHPQDWVRIATAVVDLVENEGLRSVLIFHGTDTAGYTAAALSFLLAGLDATVVITGSNIPAGQPDTDALTNVQDALTAARSLAPGVYLSFAGVADSPSEVHMGSAVRKVRTEGQAYESPNFGPLARIVNGEVEVLRSWPRLQVERGELDVDENVTYLPLHPGIDLAMYADAFIASGKRGVVLRLYPCATGPDSDEKGSLSLFVSRCISEGLTVVACLERFLESDALYPSLASLQNAGAIFAGDMIPEVALVKLSWALAQENSELSVEELFLRPIAGESISAAVAANSKVYA